MRGIAKKFSACEDVEVEMESELPFTVRKWGHSDVSQEDAAATAREAVQAMIDRFRKQGALGTYPYSQTRRPEELIEDLSVAGTDNEMLVTRNGYGALVLNTSRVMFADVDFEHISVLRRLRGWLTGNRPDPQAQVLARLELWLKGHRGWGIRVYRTFNGLRLLITHELFDPVSQQTHDLMTSMGCDPLYVKLCGVQESFRARLSPKPWRVRYSAPPNRYPRGDAEAQARFDAWLNAYEQRSKAYAICHHVKTLGTRSYRREVDAVVHVHDRYCNVSSGLPLA
ncbi:MAG: hypothetical protein ACR2RL_19325 [Gammaproteobacteria bacterium]